MKTILKPLLIIAVAIFTFSCSPEQTIENFENASTNPEAVEKMLPVGYTDSLLGTLVETYAGQCAGPALPGYTYELYVTSGLTRKNYDRVLSVAILQGNSFVDSKTLTLRAGETRTNHVPVFNNTGYTERIGIVTVKILSVNGTVGTSQPGDPFPMADGSELRTSDIDVMNCYEFAQEPPVIIKGERGHVSHYQQGN